MNLSFSIKFLLKVLSSLQNFCSAVSPQLVIKEDCDFVVTVKKEKNDDDSSCIYLEKIIDRPNSSSCSTCSKRGLEIVDLESQNKKLRNDLVSAKEHIYRLNTESREKDNEHRRLQQQMSNKIQSLRNQLIEISKTNGEYIVEKILKHNREKGKLKFCVRWEGYDSSHNSWVFEENICHILVEEYFQDLSGK